MSRTLSINNSILTIKQEIINASIPCATEINNIIDICLQNNPYSVSSNNHHLWNEQVGINIPVLYVTCIYLYRYIRRKKLTTILFATRDCSQLYKLFKTLFPNINSHYFHCSRNMFSLGFAQSVEPYTKYVTELVTQNGKYTIETGMKSTLYVDIHGSGQHLYSYFRKNYKYQPACFLLSSSCQNKQDMPYICQKSLKHKRLHTVVYNRHGGIIEMLNYDKVGTLQSFSSDGLPIRDDTEYPLSLVEPYHSAVDTFLSHLKPMKNRQLKSVHTTPLRHLLIKLLNTMYNTNLTILTTFHHIGKHKKLTSGQNEYNDNIISHPI